MNNYAKQIEVELESCGKMPLFEIAVIDNATNEQEYVTCTIRVLRNSLVADRDAVSTGELKSKFIARTSLVLDNAFTLDTHLQELHNKILDAIINGDLFTLLEEEL